MTALSLPPAPVWHWHVFGKDRGTPANSLMLVAVPAVPLWRRVLTRIILGSVWERII